MFEIDFEDPDKPGVSVLCFWLNSSAHAGFKFYTSMLIFARFITIFLNEILIKRRKSGLFIKIPGA